MARSKVSQQRPPRRQWPLSEKRRIVELTLRSGTSVGAIAREHGVDSASLSHWRRLYHAGMLGVPSASPSRVDASAGATFVPVSLIPTARQVPLAAGPDSQVGRRGIVQVVFASGATLRIESDALDAGFVCALVAELRR